MKISSFSGIYAASLTPMHEDFSCNIEELANHCRDLIHRGCDGIVLLGTTGEGLSFSLDERKRIIKTLVKEGLDPQRMIVGISCLAVEEVVQLALLAIENNYSGVLLAPPFFFKNVEERGVIAFYREVIKRTGSSDLKIFLYHIPQYTGVPITLNMIKVLRNEFPNNVKGIKESEGNLNFTKQILSTFPRFNVFVGKEQQISEAVRLGATGAISGIANAYPELIRSLFEQGKNPERPNNNEVIEQLAQLLKQYPIFPAIKKIVEQQKGTAWHILRPPLVPLNEEQSRELENYQVNLYS